MNLYEGNNNLKSSDLCHTKTNNYRKIYSSSPSNSKTTESHNNDRHQPNIWVTQKAAAGDSVRRNIYKNIEDV